MRVQNADGSVEVQHDEEPWDGSSSATSSSDVSGLLLPASPALSQAGGRAIWRSRLRVQQPHTEARRNSQCSQLCTMRRCVGDGAFSKCALVYMLLGSSGMSSVPLHP